MSTSSPDGPVASTTAGPIRGYEDQGVKVFKGVPYAASTGGANRFKPPQPPSPWGEVREARRYGDRCPQVDFPGLLPEEAISVGTEAMSEDCLNLNVWTPGVDEGRRPVMVWFHGGLFVTGSGAGTRYDGVNLCRRQDVVVVTVNHRLNLFGFLNLAELAGSAFAQSGVVGMMDCVAALRWVRDNIAGFGGDPGNVTIFGESGGGSKVSILMAMPSAAGLFHRAIAQSGVALALPPTQAGTAVASALLETLGLGADRLGELTALPVERLLEGLQGLGMMGLFGLAPVVDGEVIPRQPFSPDAPALSADVPMILGSNETEVTFFPDCPLEPIDAEELRRKLAGFMQKPEPEVERLISLYRAEHPEKDETHLYQLIASDWWLGVDVATQAERKAALGGGPAYVYRFARGSPARGGKLRAVHTLEIPYVFDNLHLGEPLSGPATGVDQALADTMSSAWARFARSGEPNGPGLPSWPPYQAERRAVMVYGDTTASVHDPHPDLRRAITELKASGAA